MNDEKMRTIGEIMKQTNKAIVSMLAYAAFTLIILAGVLYAEAHAFSMLSKMIDPDYFVWAAIGMVAVGIYFLSSLPYIIFVVEDTMHLVVMIIFLVVDLGLMIMNAIMDSQRMGSGISTTWGAAYASWVLPWTPVIVMIFVALDILVHPSIRERMRMSMAKSAVRAARMDAAIRHASSESETRAIEEQAAMDARDLIRGSLGEPLYYRGNNNGRQPAVRTYPAETVEALPAENPTDRPR